MSVGPPTSASVSIPSEILRSRMVAWIAVAVGFGLAFAPTVRILWRVWMHNPNYSHGFLVPPLTAWLIWRQRKKVAEVSDGGTWAGLWLLVPAALLQIVGTRGEVATIQGAALVLGLAGAVLQLHGVRALTVLAFPILFLVFMIPTLPLFLNTISFKLKILAAQGAVAAAQGLGILVERDGVNLVFPEGVLAVENACSGLRSLVALVALGALFAYISDGKPWRRALLFLLAVPIAVFANILRIAALCAYAGIASPTEAAGAFHTAGGYALFGVAFLLLALARRILRC